MSRTNFEAFLPCMPLSSRTKDDLLRIVQFSFCITPWKLPLSPISAQFSILLINLKSCYCFFHSRIPSFERSLIWVLDVNIILFAPPWIQNVLGFQTFPTLLQRNPAKNFNVKFTVLQLASNVFSFNSFKFISSLESFSVFSKFLSLSFEGLIILRQDLSILCVFRPTKFLWNS